MKIYIKIKQINESTLYNIVKDLDKAYYRFAAEELSNIMHNQIAKSIEKLNKEVIQKINEDEYSTEAIKDIIQNARKIVVNLTGTSTITSKDESIIIVMSLFLPGTIGRLGTKNVVKEIMNRVSVRMRNEGIHSNHTDVYKDVISDDILESNEFDNYVDSIEEALNNIVVKIMEYLQDNHQESIEDIEVDM